MEIETKPVRLFLLISMYKRKIYYQYLLYFLLSWCVSGTAFQPKLRYFHPRKSRNKEKKNKKWRIRHDVGTTSIRHVSTMIKYFLNPAPPFANLIPLPLTPREKEREKEREKMSPSSLRVLSVIRKNEIPYSLLAP